MIGSQKEKEKSLLKVAILELGLLYKYAQINMPKVIIDYYNFLTGFSTPDKMLRCLKQKWQDRKR